MKAESPLAFLAVLTCHSHICMCFMCVHTCMGSEDRVEAQSYRIYFSDPLCFSDLLCLIFL